MKRRLVSPVLALYCILSVAIAAHLKETFDKDEEDTSTYMRFSSQEPLHGENNHHAHMIHDDGESYNPFSDKFYYHSLYDNIPDVDYSSLASDLAVFVPEVDQEYFTIPMLTEDLINSLVYKQTAKDEYTKLITRANIFRKLRLYELFTDHANRFARYKLVKDKHYCDEVDVLTLIYPENLFHNYNVIDSYSQKSIQKMLKNVSDFEYVPYMKKSNPSTLKPRILRPNISVIFGIDQKYDVLRNVGMKFNCITQSYASLKGAVEISTKHNMVRYFEQYKQKNLPQTCINYDIFFPSSYRLSNKEECETFFKILNSPAYTEAKENTPVQYLLKVGAGTHQGKGVEVLSDELEEEIITKYSRGKSCGMVEDDLIAQKYISNPLLIYDQQKFDFRIYVLIASANPLIAFYRDGFVRTSLRKYNPNTSDKQSHLTNSHLSDDLVNHAKTKAEKDKLLAMQLSTFQMLAGDLESKGKIHGEDGKREFIDNLRKRFKTAISHILRFTEPVFEKRSGSFRVMGFDFMLDEDMNLWFIEANHAPQMSQTEAHRRYFTEILIRDALEIEFALLRSRVKRLRKFVEKAAREYRLKGDEWDVQGLRNMFKEANKEKFEPEFEISSTNCWEKIVDRSLSENEETGYLGHLDHSCF